MYKRMLILLDGSNLAEVVFSYARELSGRLKLDLDLLHVCKPEHAEELPMRQAYIQNAVERIKTKSGKAASEVAFRLATRYGRVRGQVVVGYPAEEILKYAEEHGVDIVMLATHGSSGIRRWGIGSVADKVIHETKVPVWLVPSHLHDLIIKDELPNRSILVPLDGSKAAEAVIPHVRELIMQRGAESEVLLVHVVKTAEAAVEMREEVRRLSGEMVSSLRSRAEIYLKSVSRELTSAGIRVQVEQLVGDPAEEIVRYAAQYQPRLIAMLTHGRTGFNRFVFSSVTENVLRRLQRTPLFLIRPGLDMPTDQDQTLLTEIETDGEDRDR